MLVNDIPVKSIIKLDKTVIYLLEKILWIRPEDVESAIERSNRGKKVETNW